jgi:hypothetical protein
VEIFGDIEIVLSPQSDRIILKELQDINVIGTKFKKVHYVRAQWSIVPKRQSHRACGYVEICGSEWQYGHIFCGSLNVLKLCRY